MEERWIKWVCTLAMLLAASGCAQTQYNTTDLPRQYAAAPTRNFAKVDFTPFAKAIADGETLQQGDQLSVSLDTGMQVGGEESKLEWKVNVDASGQAVLPHIGPVRVAGLTRTDAEQQIKNASLQRDVFLTPTVGISVEKQIQRTILVSGAVKKPGPITIRGDGVTLADVLVRAGGLTSEATGEVSVTGSGGSTSTDSIRPVGSTGRGAVSAQTVSLATTPPSQFGEMFVPDGSVVHVEESPPRPIKVVGVIKNQAVEVPSGENVRLLDALTLAGGQKYSNWISDKVTVIRRVPERNETIRIKGSIRGAKNHDAENILLAPYDIVSVEENILTFTLSTLSGLLGAGVAAAQIGM